MRRIELESERELDCPVIFRSARRAAQLERLVRQPKRQIKERPIRDKQGRVIGIGLCFRKAK